MKMKKLIPGTIAAMGICLSLSIPAAADNTEFVRDEYGLLSNQEVQTLESYGEQLFEEKQCGVYLRVTKDIGGYSDASDFAEYLYVVEELGYGDDHAGILFVVSMGERDYAVTVYGSAYDVFTDRAVNGMIDDILSDLSYGNWYDAFETYYSDSGNLLRNYNYHETEYDNDDDLIIIDPPAPEKQGANPIILAIGSLISSLMVCLGLRSKNKTTGERYSAQEYMSQITMTNRLDLFTHHTVSRVRVSSPPSSHSGDGGGGITTTYHSSGFHSTSGKF